MSDFHHGVEVIEINDGTRTISTVSTASSAWSVRPAMLTTRHFL